MQARLIFVQIRRATALHRSNPGSRLMRARKGLPIAIAQQTQNLLPREFDRESFPIEIESALFAKDQSDEAKYA